MTEHAHPFAGAEIIYEYSLKQAVEDGMYFDPQQGELAEVCRQHFKHPIYLSEGVFTLMRQAVEAEGMLNDYKGVLHDILTMCRSRLALALSPESREFRVIITGTGKRKLHTMRATCQPWCSADPKPVIAIYLPEED